MTVEFVVWFPRMSMALNSPQRVHSTSAWQSFLLSFVIQFRLLIFHQEETKRGNWHKNWHKNSGLVSKPHFSPLEFVPTLLYASTSQGIYLAQSHLGTLNQMPMPDVEVACCYCGEVTASSQEGLNLLLAGLSPLPRAVTRSSWCSFPSSLFSLFLHQSRVSVRATHSPPPGRHPTVHPLGHGRGCILLLWGQSQKYSTALGNSLCAWMRQPISATCQIRTDGNVTHTGDWSFIFFMTSCLLADWDQGLAERVSVRKRADLPPAPSAPASWGFRGGCMGSVFARHSDLFNPKQMSSITILSPNIWLLQFSIIWLD